MASIDDVSLFSLPPSEALGRTVAETLGIKVAQHELRRIGGWVASAAQRKDVPAMYALATMYEKGWGPARDLQTAKRWYRNAAAAGDARAMTRLGALYADDLQASHDPKARAWFQDEMLSMYRQAAQLNDQEAKAWLAQHDPR